MYIEDLNFNRNHVRPLPVGELEVDQNETNSQQIFPDNSIDDNKIAKFFKKGITKAYVAVFPDGNTGLIVVDDEGNDVFKALIGGADVGDVIMGDIDSQYVQWDKSTGQIIINGQSLDATILSIANVAITASASEINLLDGVTRLRLITTPWNQWSAGNPARFCANDTDIFYSNASATGGSISRNKINSDNSLQPVQISTSDSSWLANQATYDFKNGVGCDATYIYTWVQKVADASYLLLRITIADKTLTEMTISGTAPDADASNSVTMGPDGVLYIANTDSTDVKKYIISGTTATYSASVTLSTAMLNGALLMLSIGRNGDIVYRDSTGSFVVRDDSSGALQGTINEETSQTFGGVFYCNGEWYWLWDESGTVPLYHPYIYGWV